METLKPPKPITLDSNQNLSDVWKKWKSCFTIFLQATESIEKPDVTKSSILLHCIGPQAKEIYDTFQFEAGNEMKFNNIIEKFDEYFNPRKNLTFNRYNFLTARQNDTESFDEFYTRLRKLSENCELGELRDSLIKDIIIIGIRDTKLKERFLRENDINLETVLKNGRACEASKKQSKTLKSEKETLLGVHQVHDRQPSKDQRRTPPRNPKTYYPKSKSNDMINKCKFCTGSHPRGACPAYGKTCNNCGKIGHYSKCCLKSKSNDKKRVNTVQTDQQKTSSIPDLADHSSSDESDNEYFLGTVTTEKKSEELFIGAIDDKESTKEWLVTIESNELPVTYKLDTGAEANVIPIHQFYKFRRRPTLHKTKTRLTAYNQTPIKVEGRCIINLNYRSKTYPTLFIIAHTKSKPILGLQACERLNLVKRIDSSSSSEYTTEYSDCFGELGTLDTMHHIYTDPSIPPVIDACRKVPIALQPRLKAELQRMENLEIIKPVTEPTDWVSSLAIAHKPNGDLRICLDPRNLNKAIRRHHHQMPTTDEILSKMAGAKYFTKMDASNAYWQIPLDDESSRLLTFNTPFGRYRYLRMPYGIHSASEICQSHIASIIENIPGTANCQDDIIIWGSTLEELHERTHLCLQAIRKSGLKLRKNKCQFDKTSLTFLGHHITADGISPDKTKISAITNYPAPTNVKELQRFLGMVTYLGKFIPNLSKETAPLRKLLEKDIEWHMDKPQIDAFNNLKKLVTTHPVLQYFDINRKCRITCDASKKGLGAVLEQKFDEHWSPVAYASRALSPAESNYCPLERETLAIVYACERFHEYVYGQDFVVVSDHQPLKSIFNKPLSKSPARLQRFRLRLQKYSFNVEYQRGKFMFVADALSRAPTDDPDSEISDEELDACINAITENMPISDSRLSQFVKETQSDPTLQHLQQQIRKGWPESPKQLLHKSITPYYSYRDELGLQNNLIVKGERIVVPSSMRQEMLRLLHIGHPGIQTIKDRARESLFWPGINAQLEQTVTSCDACQEHRNKQPKEPQLQHEIPETPWTKLATDVFHLKRKHYVLLVDYTTKYFDISQITDTQSRTVAEHTKAMLSRYGIPKEIVSDGGPEYIGNEYVTFCKEWDIEHTYSSPEYPQSNGLAERTVQTVKRVLKKAIKKKEDLHLALLQLKSSKSATTGCPPTSALFNRRVRTLIPSINTKPKSSEVTKTSSTQQGRPLPLLQPGDNVRFHDGNSWARRATVVSQCKEPRSYRIRTDKDTIIRRNRRHLLKTTEQFNLSDNSDVESLLKDNEEDEDSDSTTVPYREPEEVIEPQNELRTTKSGRVINAPRRFKND